nr:uncharacterized protein LOC110362202 isoform X2 [Columba livia]
MVCPRFPRIWGQIQLRLLSAAGRPASEKQALPGRDWAGQRNQHSGKERMKSRDCQSRRKQGQTHTDGSLGQEAKRLWSAERGQHQILLTNKACNQSFEPVTLLQRGSIYILANCRMPGGRIHRRPVPQTLAAPCCLKYCYRSHPSVIIGLSHYNYCYLYNCGKCFQRCQQSGKCPAPLQPSIAGVSQLRVWV